MPKHWFLSANETGTYGVEQDLESAAAIRDDEDVEEWKWSNSPENNLSEYIVETQEF
jgi:hypothetical protein